MPNRSLNYSTTTVTGSPAAASETIIATSPPVEVSFDQQTVHVSGMCNFTVGTSGNAATLKLRRSTVTGTQVGSTVTLPVTTVVAGDTVIGNIEADDTPGFVGGQVYVMTLTVASGAATSTVNNVRLTARID